MKGYQLKITVKGSKPPVWRRIIVPETATFHQLHEMIQEAFGWSGYHLHEFEFSKKKLLVRNTQACAGIPEGGCSLLDENEPVRSLIEENPRFVYTYDFKDRWEHQILFEKEAECEAPQVVKLKGGNFPENCGGVKAFYEKEMTVSEEDYDLEAVNRRLAALAQPEPVPAPKPFFIPPRNPADPCPCRSGKRYRQCCGRRR